MISHVIKLRNISVFSNLHPNKTVIVKIVPEYFIIHVNFTNVSAFLQILVNGVEKLCFAPLDEIFHSPRDGDTISCGPIFIPSMIAGTLAVIG